MLKFREILQSFNGTEKHLANKELKYHLNQPGSLFDLSSHIQAITENASAIGKDIIILCIGTDRSTGDALGPLTGSKLKHLSPYPHIYGTLDQPIHATNLVESVQKIQQTFDEPFIIAVDACLGRTDSVGTISVGQGPLKPGAAVNKELPAVGDAYITGIVNVGGFMEHLVLQSTRLSLVVKLADSIAYGLSYGLRRLPS